MRDTTAKDVRAQLVSAVELDLVGPRTGGLSRKDAQLQHRRPLYSQAPLHGPA